MAQQDTAVSSRRRTRRLCWLFAIVALCLLTGLITRFWPREPLLLEHSRRIADLPGRADYVTIFWRSDQECLLFTTSGGYGLPVEHVWRAEQINAQTGQSVPVAWLDKAIKKGEGVPYRFQASPDGNWLLWYDVQTGDGFGVSVVARTDGRDWHTQDTDRHSDVYWLDDTHWAEDKRTYFDEHGSHVGDHRRLIVYNVEKPEEARIIREHSPQERQVQAQIESHNPHRFTTESDEHEDFEVKPGEIAELLPGHEKRKPLHVYRIPLPTGATPQDVIIAPSGRLAACFVTREYVEPFSKFLHRMLPAFRVKTQKRQSLWVGCLGSKEWREVGYLPCVPDEYGNDIREVLWLPGEQRLSFVCNDALWTVPVN